MKSTKSVCKCIPQYVGIHFGKAIAAAFITVCSI